MDANKHLALSLEKQHLRSTRKYYLLLHDINTELSKIHKNLHKKIDLPKYTYATQYIHDFISHTTVWNLKFSMNLESPEVALLQIFHLEYIFTNEHPEHFTQERTIFEEVKKRFYDLQPFSQEHVEARLTKMLAYIKEKSDASLTSI